MESFKLSGFVLSELGGGLRGVWKLESGPNLFADEVYVFEHVSAAGHSLSADGSDIFDAVVNTVNGCAEGQGAAVEAVLYAGHAVGHASFEIAEGAGMADGGANSPAAVATLEVGKAAGLNGVPLVDAAGGLAGDVAAAEAGEDFVHSVHSILVLI